MVTKNVNDYLEKIKQPIAGERPQGDRLVDDPMFDYIESQMMKVGSLAHGEVPWLDVERATVALLEQKSKDVKLLAYLLQCLQHRSTIERFSCSIASLATFIEHHWDNCHPAPGESGVLPRRRFFVQMSQRTLKSAKAIAPCDDPAQWQLLDSHLKQLRDVALAKSLPLDDLDSLNATLSALREIHKSAPTKVTSSPKDQSQEAQVEVTSHLAMDRSNSKSSKQALLKVADFICESETSFALGLRLRRLATWFSITSVPESANDKGETSLMPVSPDRIAEYQSAIRRNPDLALLRKIEQSLCLSPFWLDGHYLVAQLAQQLGYPQWSQAIREEAQAFVSRLPELLTMSFKGGAPFVSKETQGWLREEGSTAGAGETNSKVQDIWALAESGGLSLALSALNEQLASAKEPRDQFYFRLLGAELKDKQKLGALAQSEYQALLEQAEKTTLAEWEPGLLSRIKERLSIS